jgi:hypothetical protein
MIESKVRLGNFLGERGIPHWEIFVNAPLIKVRPAKRGVTMMSPLIRPRTRFVKMRPAKQGDIPSRTF